MEFGPHRTILDEITDFLSMNPTSEEIIPYRLPEELLKRGADLMELNRQNRLSNEERAEMETFMQAEHLMTLLKAKSRLWRDVNPNRPIDAR